MAEAFDSMVENARHYPGAARRWTVTLLAFIVAVCGTEAMPLFPFRAGPAIGDWLGFIYVTMKFVVLPGASLLILTLVGFGIRRRRHLSIWPAATGGVAVIYWRNSGFGPSRGFVSRTRCRA